jgi:hypothetical protein
MQVDVIQGQGRWTKMTLNRANVTKLLTTNNLTPFHGHTIILIYKSISPGKIPWNGNKLLQYFNPRKSRVKITVVIYCSISFITLAPGCKLTAQACQLTKKKTKLKNLGQHIKNRDCLTC